MGTTNFGNQTLTFKYRQPSNAESFNNLLYNILPSGIYSGGSISIVNDTTARISILEALISDSVSEVTIKCATSLEIDVSVSESTPFIIMRLEWENSPNNYVDFLSVSLEDIRDTDLILGKAVYISTVFSEVDYSIKSLPSFEKSGYDLVIDSNQKLLDWASGVYDGKCNRVFIKSGIWVLSSGNIDLLARGTDIIDCQDGAVLHFENISSTLDNATAITYGGTFSPTYTKLNDKKRIVNLTITGSNNTGTEIIGGFFNCINLLNCKSEITSDIGVSQFTNCSKINNCFAINNNADNLTEGKIGYLNCNKLFFCNSEGLDNTLGYSNCSDVYSSLFYSEGVANLKGFYNSFNIFSSNVSLLNSDTSAIGFDTCNNMFYSGVELNPSSEGTAFDNCTAYLDTVSNTPNSRVIRGTDGSILANEGANNNNVTINSQLLPFNALKVWIETYSYSLNEIAFYEGVIYKSLSDLNSGNHPDLTVGTSWENVLEIESHGDSHAGDGSDPIPVATQSVDGLMSSEDKTTLDGLAGGELNTILTLEASSLGITYDNTDLYSHQKFSKSLSREIGELITLQHIKDPVTWAEAKSTANPSYPEYFPAIPRYDGNHDITSAQAPLLVSDFITRSITSGTTTIFSGVLTSGVISLNATVDNDHLCIALVEAALVLRWYDSGQDADYATLGGLYSGTGQYCVRINNVNYGITNVDAVARTITIDSPPADGAVDFTVPQYGVPASNTSIRLRQLSGFVPVACGDYDGEILEGLVKMDRIQGIRFNRNPAGATETWVQGSGGAGFAAGVVGGGGGKTTGDMVTDGANGAPRKGKTTNPRSYGVAVYTWARTLLARDWA